MLRFLLFYCYRQAIMLGFSFTLENTDEDKDIDILFNDQNYGLQQPYSPSKIANVGAKTIPASPTKRALDYADATQFDIASPFKQEEEEAVIPSLEYILLKQSSIHNIKEEIKILEQDINQIDLDAQKQKNSLPANADKQQKKQFKLDSNRIYAQKSRAIKKLKFAEQDLHIAEQDLLIAKLRLENTKLKQQLTQLQYEKEYGSYDIAINTPRQQILVNYNSKTNKNTLSISNDHTSNTSYKKQM